MLRFIIIIVCRLSIIGSPAIAQEPKPAASPNVVIFFMDDLGYKDLGCYGSEFYETPNIDALCKQSVKFSNFYSANPVCSPTRAAMMTGKAPQRMGITNWIPKGKQTHLPRDEYTMAEAFKAAGYATGYIGKWHLGNRDTDNPSHHGFDWIRAVNHGGSPGSYFHPFKKPKGSKNIDHLAVPDLEDTKQGDYLTDKLTDLAIEFVEENHETKKPFFLCFSHYAVHTPIQSKKDLIKKYEMKRQKKWGNSVAASRDESQKATTRTRQDNPKYAAMVESVDESVGRIANLLAELKLTENTIVIFTSDNGGLSTYKGSKGVGPTSCEPLRAGKGWTYEGGIRIPTMISWPSKIDPQTSATLGITMDIYPTLLELAGLVQQPDQHKDGVSLVATLMGKPVNSQTERFLAWYFPHNHGSGHTPSSAIRKGNWKLVHHIDTGKDELFDLESDLSETTDLASKHPEKRSELANMLNDWVESTTADASK